MTDESAAFAAWLLGLLPRLALWPGGGGLTLVLGGVWWLRQQGRATTLALSPLERLGLALAWVAVALLPLPGAAPLPLAPDGLVLLGLLLAAEGVAGASTRAGSGLGLCAGAVAVLAAGAGRVTLPFASLPGPVLLLAAIAYAWGLASMADPAPRTPHSALRLLLWLGWLGLGIQIPSPWNWLLVVSALVLLLALTGRPRPAHLAGRMVGLGWLALAGAVVAVLLA